MQKDVDHPAVAEYRDGLVMVVGAATTSATAAPIRARNASSSTPAGR